MGIFLGPQGCLLLGVGSSTALATTTREIYIAVAAPRGQLVIGAVQGAIGYMATKVAVARAKTFGLDEHQSVVVKSCALRTLDAKMVECFESLPEVDTSQLIRWWKNGLQRKIDASDV